jgi:hypothetical protein
VVSQFEFSATRNEDIEAASIAAEDVVLPAGRYGPEGTSNFFLNTATGAMKVRPDAWPIVEKALVREIKRIKVRLYFRFALLYFEKFSLQCRARALHSFGLIFGLFY